MHQRWLKHTLQGGHFEGDELPCLCCLCLCHCCDCPPSCTLYLSKVSLCFSLFLSLSLSLSLPPSLLLLLQISTKFGCSYAFADQECFLHLVFPYSPKLVFLGSLGIVYFNSSSSDGVQNRPMIFVGTVRLNFTYFSVK
jgi:hypothetical protein